MNERSSVAIVSIGIGVSPDSPSLIACCMSSETAAAKPVASGSTVTCHPASVESIQSERLSVLVALVMGAKSVASLSQS